MRTINWIAWLLLSLTGTTVAQQTGGRLAEPGASRKFDGISHIEVDLDRRNTMLVGFSQYAQVRARQNVDSVLRLFMADYRQVEDSTQSLTRATHALFRLGETDRALDLRFTEQPTVSFRFSEATTPVQVKTQQDTLQLTWGSTVSRLPYYDFTIYLFLNSLSDVESLLKAGGINDKLQAALESVRQYKGHDLTNPRMSFDMVQSADRKATFLGPGLSKRPFISFQPGIGIGFIKTEVTPSLNVDLQFVPSRFRTVGYTVGYTSNFFLTGNRIDFVNIGMAFYRKSKKGQIVSFDKAVATFYVGYLVRDGLDVFSRHTIRIGGTVYQRGLLKVQPELYVGSTLKTDAQIYPGLRLVVGL